MNLKTLKDLIWYKNCHYDVSTMESFTWILRQEVIKRVKVLLPLIKSSTIKRIDKQNVIEWTYSGKRTEMDLFRMGQVSEDIKFFNITEEDLK